MHHYKNLDAVLKEMYRVLVPEGTLIMFTSFIEQSERHWIGHYFPHIWELSRKTIKSQKDLDSALKIAGFKTVRYEKYFISKETKDLTVYAGKYKPEIYLDPVVRAGMTPFNIPEYAGDIEEGIKALKADIECGEINNIIALYESDLGENVYVIATKE